MSQNPKRLHTAWHNRLLRIVLVIAAALVALLFLLLPLAVVFVEALSKGLQFYFQQIAKPDTVSAIKLSIKLALVAVPLNMIFGIAAAWVITKFEFRGKRLLISFIDLPFTVAPVISGLVWVLIFGMQGWLGPFFRAHNIEILFAFPGMLLAILFVTFPFVARELIPLMQQQGTEEEEAAVSLGANFRQVFFRVTLPNIKIGLVYGILLSNARALGEFGAISLVSGMLRGSTVTMPLEVEILFNEYNAAGAFVVASLLSLSALLTLLVRSLLEYRHNRRQPELPSE
ncbi:MAG: sulfate ABC transporter permease subunit CysW [Candidatus Pacebacteria bacterium]|nr:sulfate ABC transporter permease subunit CysW [Candidatus Paceibacterota bacterium]